MMSPTERRIISVAGLAALATLLAAASTAWAGHGGSEGIIAPPPTPTNDIAFMSDRFSEFSGIEESDIFTMTETGANQTRLTTEGGSFPVWSPDGNRIAFETRRDGNWEIYVMDADGQNETNITNHPADEHTPVWSPDGSRIAFDTDRDVDNQIGDHEIYVIDANGANPVNLTNSEADDTLPSWSPDGTRITFARGPDLWIMNADGGSQAELAASGGPVTSRAAWKPDGSRLLFSTYRDNRIWAVDPDGSHLGPLFEGASPDWSPNGNRIVFERSEGRGEEIWTADENGDNQLQLTDNDRDDHAPHWKAGGFIGDVNCDSMVNAIDAALLLQLLAGLVDGLPCPENADCNQDGRTDAIDAALILQYNAGLIQSLPA